MKPKLYPERDLFDPGAGDVYERAMERYQALLAEAEHERLLRQARGAGPKQPGLPGKLLVSFGGMLIFVGVWFQKLGR